jgi:hypothetical protein
VRGIFASLAKFVAAQAIYQSNNPNLVKFARAFEDSFRSYFEEEAELVLAVSQYQLVWREQVVYDIGPNTESIAFLLYKDGVGEVCVLKSVERAELEEFTRILKTALYHPSTQFDIATALWHAEFSSITYRVLDEQSDAAEGEGDGAGSSQREQPLRANDHHDLPASEMQQRISREADAELEPLGEYYQALAAHAGAAGSAEHEEAFQRILREALRIDEQALAAWSASRTERGGDELLGFLRIMLDFTRMECPPPVIRDVTDTIERLIHYIRDEGNVTTLTATLEIEKELRATPLQAPFSPLPARIRAELTDPEYLVALARGSRDVNTPFDLLRYLSLVGAHGAPAVWELLSRHSDDAVHEKGCALLLDMDGLDLEASIAAVDVEAPRLARDVVYLLARADKPALTPAVQRMAAADDPQTRRAVIELVVKISGDESARLLGKLLRDENPAVRQRAWSGAGSISNALVAADVEALCFADSAALRTSDELELMFRALGRVCGFAVLPRLRAMVEKKQRFTVQKKSLRREKLLAITALRYIPGADAQRILDTLSADSDTLVRTKAAHAIRQRSQPGLHDSAELSTAGEDAS